MALQTCVLQAQGMLEEVVDGDKAKEWPGLPVEYLELCWFVGLLVEVWSSLLFEQERG